MQSDSHAPSSTFDWSRVIPIFVLVFVDVLGLTLILPLLHLYGTAYGATALQIGFIAAAFPLAQLIGVPMMGALSDRFGRKPLLLISQISTCISFIILAFAGSVQIVILSRFIDGLFGANIATAQAAITDITSEENRAKGLGLTGAAFGLGFVFGPVLSLVAMELADNLYAPALSAAMYSMISILLTLFVFRETLPPERRGQNQGRMVTPFLIFRFLRRPGVNMLLILMFAQQLFFFGFESLLGLFTLSRLGFLGMGNTLIFLVVGSVLVLVQFRYIGKWTKRYGERKVIFAALSLLSAGLILVALTPEQPHIFYVQGIVEYELRDQAPDTTQAILGDINVSLPDEANRGIGGMIWVFFAIIPLSVGAGLIRPSINSLITKRVNKQEYGSALGVSSAFVSAANAIAPIMGGLLIMQYGVGLPFLLFGVVMACLFCASLLLVKPDPNL